MIHANESYSSFNTPRRYPNRLMGPEHHCQRCLYAGAGTCKPPRTSPQCCLLTAHHNACPASWPHPTLPSTATHAHTHCVTHVRLRIPHACATHACGMRAPPHLPRVCTPGPPQPFPTTQLDDPHSHPQPACHVTTHLSQRSMSGMRPMRIAWPGPLRVTMSRPRVYSTST